VILHPTLMVLSIIATGNHWWIDAAAAAAIILGVVMISRMITLWAGDRHWSWTAMRFQTRDGVAKLEALANSTPATEVESETDDSGDEGRTLETVD
jgi:hypothetical protein